jgi:hypothetical protein
VVMIKQLQDMADASFRPPPFPPNSPNIAQTFSSMKRVSFQSFRTRNTVRGPPSMSDPPMVEPPLRAQVETTENVSTQQDDNPPLPQRSKHFVRRPKTKFSPAKPVSADPPPPEVPPKARKRFNPGEWIDERFDVLPTKRPPQSTSLSTAPRASESAPEGNVAKPWRRLAPAWRSNEDGWVVVRRPPKMNMKSIARQGKKVGRVVAKGWGRMTVAGSNLMAKVPVRIVIARKTKEEPISEAEPQQEERAVRTVAENNVDVEDRLSRMSYQGTSEVFRDPLPRTSYEGTSEALRDPLPRMSYEGSSEALHDPLPRVNSEGTSDALDDPLPRMSYEGPSKALHDPLPRMSYEGTSEALHDPLPRVNYEGTSEALHDPLPRVSYEGTSEALDNPLPRMTYQGTGNGGTSEALHDPLPRMSFERTSESFHMGLGIVDAELVTSEELEFDVPTRQDFRMT